MAFYRERIIVTIFWWLSNLKETYLGHRCLNGRIIGMFKHRQPMFKWALLTNMYDYTLPFFPTLSECHKSTYPLPHTWVMSLWMVSKDLLLGWNSQQLSQLSLLFQFSMEKVWLNIAKFQDWWISPRRNKWEVNIE